MNEPNEQPSSKDNFPLSGMFVLHLYVERATMKRPLVEEWEAKLREKLPPHISVLVLPHENGYLGNRTEIVQFPQRQMMF